MKAAFIVMSILGCDDSGVQCQPVATVGQQWTTIADCDAASERELVKYTNVKFPMVVAVCQTANTTALADSVEDIEEGAVVTRSLDGTPKPPEDKANPGLTARAIALVGSVLPSRKGVINTLEKPVHFVTDTYSWVARKIVP